ncbi:S8 family peptidase [Chryseobacterium sp. HR92]|uniref:S8 family peptidase n=1 Tax=Chryseobacterium sp. HR92 TaxID=3094839 RepID=UPI003890233A|nr:S8 family peptidase [Chryseobacterium sp. HR92]
MKKIFISISTLIISLASAQQSNEKLMNEFEKQRIENNKKFDNYVEKLKRNRKDETQKAPNKLLEEITKNIENKKSSVAGFTPDGSPYFQKLNDVRQIKNSNADQIQNGQINGLSGSFNGENIKYTVFDGGRVLESHQLFNNLPNRIINKENQDSIAYHFHATAISGFIGAKPYSLTKTFYNPDGSVNATFNNLNLAGVAKSSTIDSYFMNASTLPGNTTQSNIFQKILIAQPKISNHSYGITAGWEPVEVSQGQYALVWRGAFSSPNNSANLNGTYFAEDQNYDKIVYSNPSYIIVKAAGNDYGMGPTAYNFLPAFYLNNSGHPVQFSSTDTKPADNCSQGYDCIGIGSLAKNIIVVANNTVINNNENRYTASADVIHSASSSAGPRDDGGIKPDITATGTDVVSASVNSANQEDYEYGTGTSYSTPIVTGIIGLWAQINQQLFAGTELNAASAKTLMVHSALEAGNIGPDPHFGWGLINAKKGAELLVGKANNSVIFSDQTLVSGTAYTKTVTASGTEPLKVTISWIDPAYNVNTNTTWAEAYNNKNSRLVNDLDLKITDTTTNTVYYPWKLNANNPMTPATKGDNTVDNVEQVVIDAPVAGRTYKVEITNKGTLKNDSGGNAPQNYSIIVTGFTELLGTKEAANPLNNLAISPTITKDFTNILKAPKKSTFSVYDLTGKKLQNGIINNDKEQIDLSTYTKGIYIIEVKTDKDVISKKVIKE